MIRVKNCSFSYGKTQVLKNLTLHFNKGQTTLISGPAGAGKTTLLRMIGGILRPSEGRVALDKYMTFANIRRRTAYIPSSLGLYEDMTLSDMVRLHASFYRKYNFAVPDGYGFDMKRTPGSLSREERAFFYLCLVLGTDPMFLIADDVLRFTDTRLRDLSRGILAARMENPKKGMIIASRDTAGMEDIIDRVVIVSGGTITVDSSLKKLKSRSPDLFAAVTGGEYDQG